MLEARSSLLRTIAFVAALAYLLSAASPVLSQTPDAHPTGGERPVACQPWAARLISYQGTLSTQRASGILQASVREQDVFCEGDVLTVGAYSRAALQLPDDTVIRVDQGSIISFAAPKDDKRTWLDILKGAVHIISRDPRALRVITPFANAGIEGTEFFVQVGPNTTFVLVYEGRVKVQNPLGEATAGSGESVVAQAGSAPVLQQIVRPRDRVVWTLYYPPTATGKLPAADASTATPNADFYVGRAEQRLALGRVSEAEADLNAALQLAPDSAEVLARQSVIALTRNDERAARASADRAVEQAPASAAPRLAQSYVRQSNGDLPGAIDSLETAAANEPGNALVRARLAELWLASGDVARSEKNAKAAVAADPEMGLAHTVLGFAALARVDLAVARREFDRAIQLDPNAPLSRLGLGLAKIRGGDLKAGRAEIETAVILDPNNSLVRSYMGKAYYEEKRNQLAASQLEIAKDLDPNDPTPWFYDAIRKQTVNAPISAIADLQDATDRNDNRTVYRSRLLLDQDEAARSASLGRIYGTVGFSELALRQGWAAIEADPRDYSGHRLLADSYAALARHEIARVNELIQSQLLQPLNTTVVQPQLAEANLFILDSAGPSAIGFNEFNPLFVKNGLQAQTSLIAGSNNTYGADAVFAAIHDRWSFNLGGFKYETDGFRENNDLDITVGDLLIQFQLSPTTSLLGEARVSDREQGELRIRFDPMAFDSSRPRQNEDVTSVRIGVRHDFSVRSTVSVLGAFETGDYQTTLTDPPYISDTNIDAYSAELQYLYHAENWNVVSGIRYYQARYEDTTRFLGDVFTSINRPDAVSAYVYGQYDVTQALEVILGMSRDRVSGLSYTRSRWNPKAGLRWHPSPDTTVRLGVLSTLQRPTPSRQDIQPSLEPTAVVGFNQFFFGSEGEDANRYGVGVDQRLSERLAAGAEFSRRRLDIPFTSFSQFPPGIRFADIREDSVRGYLYWLASPTISMSAGYNYDLVDNDPEFTPNFTSVVETHQFPIRAGYFHPRGPLATIQATYAYQRGRFQDTSAPPFPFFSDNDDFVVVDARLGYRLPKRRGLVYLDVRNLIDKEIKFQDVDPENPRIYPERVVLLKATFAY